MEYFDKTKDELIADLLQLQQENNSLRASLESITTKPDKTDKDLMESEIKYRRLIENSPDAICIYSEGIIVLANKACFKLMATQNETDLIGKPVINFVHPDYRESTTEKMKKIGSEGIVLPLEEEKLLRLDGSVVDVEVTALTVMINEKPAVQLIVRDVSEHNRILAALRESEEKYRLIFENAPLGLLSFDENGVIVTCNEIFAQIIGSSTSRLIGLNMLQLPDKKLVAEIKKAIAGEVGTYEGIYQSVTANKATPAIAFFAPMEIGNGQIHGGVGIIKDISERLQAQEELQERKEKYRGLSEAAFESIFLSEKGICIEQNQTAQDTFGYTNEEAIGRYGTEWIVPEDREMVIKKMLTNDENPYESTALRKDGTTFPCMLRSKMMHYKGRVVRVTSLTDITDMKLAKTIASEKEYLVNSIAENSPNLIYIYHVDKNQNIYTNRNISKLLGYNEDEINDNDPEFFNKLIHPDDIRQFDYFHENVGKWPQNKVFDFEYRILSKSGEWVWFKGSEKEFQRLNNQIVSFIGTVQDVTTKKKAEVALKESEAKYRALVENGFEGILIINFEGNVLFANPALLQIFGYSEFDEVKGKSVFLFLAPESIPLAIADLTKVVQGYNMDVAQYNGVTATGTKIIIESLGKLIDFDGSKADIISVRDITAKKAIETALRESEEKYRLIAENTSDGIIGFDAENRIQYTSPAYLKQLGYSETEEFGGDADSIYKLVHPDERDTLFANIFTAIEEKKPALTYIYRALNIQGQYIWREDNAKFRYDDNGNYIGCYVVCRDINERRKAEFLLQESEEKFRLIAENTEDTIAVLDLDLTITYISPSIKKLTRLSQDEVLFQKIDKILNPESLNKVKALFYQILPAEMDGTAQQQSYPPIELEEFHQDGSVLWLELSFSFLKDSNNKPIGLVTVTRDISSRKKIEQELIAAKEKAEESDKLKTAFLQGINHEIRTPMNGILGFASLLKELDLSGDQQTEFIVSIEKSGNRMIETITTIVNTALIQTGQMEVSLSETNVNKLIKQTLTRFKPESDEKGLQISYYCPEGENDILINTDEEKLGFILSHLVINAIKFTDSGYIDFGFTLKKTSAVITLNAKIDGASATHSGGHSEPGELEFFVKDTGIGIPENRQSAIFAPFQHADISNIRAFQGIGLGLSVSKAYIEMLGGEIRLESKEGLGTAFYFTLPLR